MHKKIMRSLQKMDYKLDTLLDCVTTRIANTNSNSTFTVFNIKHLQYLSRAWVNKRHTFEHLLAALQSLGDLTTSPSIQET